MLFGGFTSTRVTKSNSGLRENPYFEKLADFSYMHVEMGWICPIWPSARFATKLAPMCKKPCCLAVPLIKGWKIADFLNNIFFSFFDHFFLVFGDCFAVFSLLAIFWGWHAFLRFWQHQGDIIQHWFDGKPILWKIGRFMADTAIFQVQGPGSCVMLFYYSEQSGTEEH